MANYLRMPNAKNNQDPTPGSPMLGQHGGESAHSSRVTNVIPYITNHASATSGDDSAHNSRVTNITPYITTHAWATNGDDSAQDSHVPRHTNTITTYITNYAWATSVGDSAHNSRMNTNTGTPYITTQTMRGLVAVEVDFG
ncbi:hypothetical protein PoB_005973200 [Plakobranchus ocellatus]|uniref:Uncharacterized protein n=1 Tax=Plakobranchus ocellatus TaxID=259542 RepID=A0AAV4CN36_9GAST|nr:hypothetical protein PoB_005973200 [Plakobranchus ocellatus]